MPWRCACCGSYLLEAVEGRQVMVRKNGIGILAIIYARQLNDGTGWLAECPQMTTETARSGTAEGAIFLLKSRLEGAGDAL